jgi:hypothetical protein
VCAWTKRLELDGEWVGIETYLKRRFGLSVTHGISEEALAEQMRELTHFAKPDGTLTWLSVKSQPLFQPDGTALAGVVACFADVTDQRRTEDKLRQTTLELARLQERLESGGILVPEDPA